MADNRQILYVKLYEKLKSDIVSGKYRAGEKLPSKRALAERLGTSVITVENAYSQLIAEGYVTARQRSGYYVQYSGDVFDIPAAKPYEEQSPMTETISPDPPDSDFPFTVWARLMRSVILEKGTRLLSPVRSKGAEELRRAVSGYLYRARGLNVPPEQIIIGAGTDYLYNLLIQLLGRDRIYGIENPGYTKLAKIYRLNGAEYKYIPLDDEGMMASELYREGVTAAHISPAHHFPTGIVMPISRRRAIMEWAGDGRFIIEDDYDSEFRWSTKPLPTMFGMDTQSSVIYINTFSQTIAPSVRISYMCLPERLCGLWEEKLGFYACPVASFEQYTLAKFISEGYFERHINRSKKRFRRVREKVLRLMDSLGGIRVKEENAGLHFIAEVSGDTARFLSECGRYGIKATPLSEYYTPKNLCPDNVFVVNYAAAREELFETGLIK